MSLINDTSALTHQAVSAEARTRLSERRTALDPVALLHTIREAQSALTALTAPELRLHPKTRAWSSFWSVCPTSGAGMKRILLGSVR